MTISSTTRIAGPFTGNGAATLFPFTFKVFLTTDVYVVSVAIATGVQTVLTLGPGYTVTLNANQDSNPGGTVTLPLALATGYRLIVTSSLANLQPTEYLNQGGFYPEILTASLDRATIEVQQLQQTAKQSLQFPITDPVLNNILPTAELRAGLLLGFDANGAAQTVAPTAGTVGTGNYAVPFSATPVFPVNLGSQLKIILTANVTSSTLSIGTAAGEFFAIKIVQDGTGGHTFAWPANVRNAGAINTAPNSTSTQLFAIDNDGGATALAPIMYS